MHERDQKIADLQAELDKAHRLVGQSIQWQRDAEIKMLNLRAATIEECAQAAHEALLAAAQIGHDHYLTAKKVFAAIRALKEQP